MRALILAAGRGSRMREQTENRPKCLVELGGEPLLHWQSRALRNAGVKSLGIVTGYRRDQLAARTDRAFHNDQWAETNMVASLCCARVWLEEEPVLVSYSDIFYPASTARRLAASPADIAISYDPDWLTLWQARFAHPLEDAESFALDGEGCLTDIGRKVDTLDAIGGQYMGLVKFTPDGWREVVACLAALDDAQLRRLDMTTLLGKLIERGARIQAVAHSGAWGEIDSASDLAYYQARIDDGLLDLEALTGPLEHP